MDCSSPCFVCRRQYQLVYHLVLPVLDNNGWKINLFCLSWTILVCLSIGFVCLDNNSWVINRFCPSLTIMVVYPVLSVIDDIGWYISQFIFREQYWLVYQPVLSVVDNNGWFITQRCLSWTILIIISPSFVCRGQ